MLVVNRDVSLRPLNTMDVDGTLRYLVEWETAEDLGRLFTDSTYADVVDGGVKFIGQGSNLLFVSRDYRGALAKCASRAIRLVGENDKYADLEVSAGVALDDVVAYCCRHCLWGLANLSLIPGTAGGAAVQNVGAYGVEFKDVVVKVNCYDRETHRIVSFDVGDIGYAYRDSLFKHSPAKERYIVVSTILRLSRSPQPRLNYGKLDALVADKNDIVSVREAVIAVRRSKLPEVGKTGSAGSFFKNPILTDQQMELMLAQASRSGIDVTGMPVFDVAGGRKLSAAWLIDRAGWKGVESGHARVWPTQPLVLVNADGFATGREIADLAARIMDDISMKFNVRLETEVEYL